MLENLYTNKIRPVSISIIRRDKEILVYKRKDDNTNNEFYRLIGGCIEFNETAHSAIRREFLEETSLDIININTISIFESLFTFNSKQMHEIIFLFESKFEDKSIYQKDIINGIEGVRKFKAEWINRKDFLSHKKKLFPEQILDYL